MANSQIERLNVLTIAGKQVEVKAVSLHPPTPVLIQTEVGIALESQGSLGEPVQTSAVKVSAASSTDASGASSLHCLDTSKKPPSRHVSL